MHCQVHHTAIFQYKIMIFKHIYLKIIKKRKKTSPPHNKLHFLIEAKKFQIFIFENHDNKTKK